MAEETKIDIIIPKHANAFYQNGITSVFGGLDKRKAPIIGNEADSVVDVVDKALADGRINIAPRIRVITADSSWIDDDNKGIVIINNVNDLAPIVYTLPDNPTDGQCVTFFMIEGATNKATVENNGKNINGIDTNYNGLNVNGISATFTFVEEIDSWIITQI